jgi:hypothetical protein
LTDVLDVVGLVALVVAGFLLSVWLGFAVFGVVCLWASWASTRRVRLKAEVEARRLERLRS